MTAYLRWLVSTAAKKNLYMSVALRAAEFSTRAPEDKDSALKYAMCYTTLLPYLNSDVLALLCWGPPVFKAFLEEKHECVVHTRNDGCTLYHLAMIIDQVPDVRKLPALLKEIYNSLKDNGTLFITVPNSHSITNLGKVLSCESCNTTTEYGAVELKRLLEAQGFRVIELTTKTVSNKLGAEHYVWLKGIAQSSGSDTALMGGNIFLLATK